MAQRVALGTTNTGYAYFRVSKRGYSVWDGDLRNFLMHEQLFNGFPIINAVVSGTNIDKGYYQGNSSLPIYVAETVNIWHGLGFVPFVIVSGNTQSLTITIDSNGVYVTPTSTPASSGWYSFPGGAVNIYVYGTST